MNDLLKQENLAKETMKAMEKLVKKNEDEKLYLQNVWEWSQDKQKISTEVKIQTLQDMVNVLKQELSDLTSKNKALVNQVKQNETEKITLNRVENENKELKQQVQDLNKTIELRSQHRENENKIFKEQISELRKELNLLRENSQIDMKSQVVELKQDVVDLKDELSQKDEQSKAMKGQIDEIQVIL